MQFSGKFGHRLGVARRLPALLLTALLLAAAISLAQAAPPAQSPEEGHAIFEQKCAACHTVGGGKLVGPDLQGVTTQRDEDWLRRWLVAPDKMLAEKDPIATQLLQEFNGVPMPNLGLSEADARLILAFLEHEGGGPEAETEQQSAQAPAPAPVAISAGDPALGQALFAGSARFQNGAPACMSCHTVAGISALGGGAMGPDLTQVFNAYGDAGMASVLAAPPFPTMKPIFDSRPMIPDEQANLTAFLKTTATRQPSQATGQLGLLALVVFVVLMVLAQVVWRRRLQAVRRPMVEQA